MDDVDLLPNNSFVSEGENLYNVYRIIYTIKEAVSDSEFILQSTIILKITQ